MPKPISANSIWSSPLAGASLCSVVGLVVAWSSLDAAGPEQGLEQMEQALGTSADQAKASRARGRLLKLMIANRQPAGAIALPTEIDPSSSLASTATPPVMLAEATGPTPLEGEAAWLDPIEPALGAGSETVADEGAQAPGER